jgi:hypothetical protein
MVRKRVCVLAVGWVLWVQVQALPRDNPSLPEAVISPLLLMGRFETQAACLAEAERREKLMNDDVLRAARDMAPRKAGAEPVRRYRYSCTDDPPY